MAPTPMQRHLLSSALPCISSCPFRSSSFFPFSAFSCILPSSSWPSSTRLVTGELDKASDGRRGAILLATTGSEVANSLVEREDGPNLPCGTCTGKGWMMCGFCKGQKTNVQVRANKFYRRCPSCRAAGVVICPQCKVFKCVTFPDGVDGY